MASTNWCLLFGLPPLFSFTPQSGIVLPDVDFTVHKSANSCVGNTRMGKSSLIPEQNNSQNSWPWQQPFHKQYTGGVLSRWRTDMSKNHHGANLSIPVFVLNQSSGNSTSRLLGFVSLLPEHHLLHGYVTMCFPSKEAGGSPQNSLYAFKYSAMWLELPVFHNSSPTFPL
jgi:hypothetical protein